MDFFFFFFQFLSTFSFPSNFLFQFDTSTCRLFHEMNYEGDRVNGMRHGKGKQVFDDGSHYEGDWHENKKHGHGTYKYASGASYTGT